MKTATVKYIGDEIIIGLEKNKNYVAKGTETLGDKKMYVVIDGDDGDGDGYLHSPELFKVVDDPDEILN